MVAHACNLSSRQNQQAILGYMKPCLKQTEGEKQTKTPLVPACIWTLILYLKSHLETRDEYFGGTSHTKLKSMAWVSLFGLCHYCEGG